MDTKGVGEGDNLDGPEPVEFKQDEMMAKDAEEGKKLESQNGGPS